MNGRLLVTKLFLKSPETSFCTAHIYHLETKAPRIITTMLRNKYMQINRKPLFFFSLLHTVMLNRNAKLLVIKPRIRTTKHIKILVGERMMPDSCSTIHIFIFQLHLVSQPALFCSDQGIRKSSYCLKAEPLRQHLFQ